MPQCVNGSKLGWHYSIRGRQDDNYQWRTGDATGEAQMRGTVDMNLEVVVLPVADADRAKSFYQSLGWRLYQWPLPCHSVHAHRLASLDRPPDRARMSRQQGYATCSVAVDRKISQLLDVPNMLVSAFLPEDIFTN
jgi:acetamidase/formamidase